MVSNWTGNNMEDFRSHPTTPEEVAMARETRLNYFSVKMQSIKRGLRNMML